MTRNDQNGEAARGFCFIIMSRKFSRKGKHFLLRRLLPAGLILTGAACCAYVVSSAQYNELFLPGTVINGVDVSEKTLEEAEKSIRDAEEDYSLTIRFRNGTEETLDAKDVNLSYECGDELRRILNGQNGYTWLKREFSDDEEYTLSTRISYGEKALGRSLSELPEMQYGNYESPVDANLKYETDLTFSMVPEVEGCELLPEVLTEKTGEAILGKEPLLDLSEDEEVYRQPEIRTDNQDLISRMNALNAVLGADVTVKMSDGTVRTIDKETTKNWISVKNDLYVIDEANIAAKAAEYMADVAKYDDNYGYFRSFMSTNYGMQKFDSDYLHGHTLDQKAMADTLTSMVLKGETGEIAPVYSQYEDDKDPRFGGTYVEVDIYAQRVYYYENYELIYECNCVTGTEGYRSTPSGIFSVEEKQRGRTLNGYSSDGTLLYSSYVSYWICFLPHYGLHDASWRDSFGGDIYEYDGSHGCVNLPTKAAAALYDMVDYGTPVIVFRGKVQA